MTNTRYLLVTLGLHRHALIFWIPEDPSTPPTLLQKEAWGT